MKAMPPLDELLAIVPPPRRAALRTLREAAHGGGSGPQGGRHGCRPVRRQGRHGMDAGVEATQDAVARCPVAEPPVREPAGSQSRWARTQGVPLLVPFSRTSEKMNPAAGRRAEPRHQRWRHAGDHTPAKRHSMRLPDNSERRLEALLNRRMLCHPMKSTRMQHAKIGRAHV